jgi:ribosomal protein S18 acetylase RimI-like enzyme
VYQYKSVYNPSQDDLKIVDSELGNYNDKIIGLQKCISLGSFAKDSNEKIIGGVAGELFWGWLYIDQIWVHDNYRRQKIGTNLIYEIEKLALEKRICKSHLCTTSFQAFEFYKKNRLYSLWTIRRYASWIY